MKNMSTYPYFLIVDDNVDNHFMVVTALKSVFGKPKILSVFDGQHALEYLEDSRSDNLIPDIIVLDINRSKFSNAEYFSRLKKDKWLKNVPVIVLVDSEHVNTEDLKAIGADDIYLKTDSAGELADVFRDVAENWLSHFFDHSNS
jgi:CheY-like chemotaxis protein